MTDARVTQVLVEEWSDGGAVAQVTSVFIEQWGTGPLGTQAVVTMLALEQWLTVATAATAQARAIVLA